MCFLNHLVFFKIYFLQIRHIFLRNKDKKSACVTHHHKRIFSPPIIIIWYRTWFYPGIPTHTPRTAYPKGRQSPPRDSSAPAWGWAATYGFGWYSLPGASGQSPARRYLPRCPGGGIRAAGRRGHASRKENNRAGKPPAPAPAHWSASNEAGGPEESWSGQQNSNGSRSSPCHAG